MYKLLHQYALSSSGKHACHVCLLVTFVLVATMNFVSFNVEDDPVIIDPISEYGFKLTCLLYFLRLLPLLALPSYICTFLGLTLYNAFPDKVRSTSSPLLSPFVCFRVVTRGSYPALVKRNLARNMNTCLDVGLENFIFEIVTDKAIEIPKQTRVRELVIRSDYETKNGSKFKSRALQYCLEDDNNILGDSDWIVHMDEETLLTENSVRGILNFISHGKHEFGQGLITYANEEIVNWFTTLADTYRVSDDMGKIRFQFYMFHRPLFSWKGSYVVCKTSAERDVTFDFGPDGSIAEDCYFSMVAYSKNYTFNFIEGEMWEKSPFTLKDFLQQRRRWMQGIYLVICSKPIPVWTKFFLILQFLSWISVPLTTLSGCMTIFYPLPRNSYILLNLMFAFLFGVTLYMYVYGALVSFSLPRLGLMRYVCCLIGSVLALPINIMTENIAIIWGLLSKKDNFYVVQKEVSSATTTTV